MRRNTFGAILLSALIMLPVVTASLGQLNGAWKQPVSRTVLPMSGLTP
jgi:hypothetical protein